MKVIKIILTFILQLILIVSEIGLGLMLCSKNFLTPESLSENIQQIDIQEILVDEEGNKTETGKQIYSFFEYANLSESETNLILNDGAAKKMLGDFISTATLSQTDDTIEIKYPSISEITNVVYNNYDKIKDTYNIDKDKSEVTKEDIQAKISENYGDIRAKLKAFAESLGESNE